jgi:hypothetical protein
MPHNVRYVAECDRCGAPCLIAERLAERGDFGG